LSSMRSSQGDMRVTSSSSSGISKYACTNSRSWSMTVSCARARPRQPRQIHSSAPAQAVQLAL